MKVMPITTTLEGPEVNVAFQSGFRWPQYVTVVTSLPAPSKKTHGLFEFQLSLYIVTIFIYRWMKSKTVNKVLVFYIIKLMRYIVTTYVYVPALMWTLTHWSLFCLMESMAAWIVVICELSFARLINNDSVCDLISTTIDGSNNNPKRAAEKQNEREKELVHEAAPSRLVNAECCLQTSDLIFVSYINNTCRVDFPFLSTLINS